MMVVHLLVDSLHTGKGYAVPRLMQKLSVEMASNMLISCCRSSFNTHPETSEDLVTQDDDAGHAPSGWAFKRILAGRSRSTFKLLTRFSTLWWPRSVPIAHS
jgi:hypothetical protein